MPCPVFSARSLAQEEILCRRREFKPKRASPRTIRNTALYSSKLYFQNLPQIFLAQAIKNHNPVDAVHKFRGKGPLRLLNSNTFESLLAGLAVPRSKTQTTD